MLVTSKCLQQRPASGTLAQLVEQRTFNPFVVGSTPARPTKRFDNYNSFDTEYSSIAQLVERRTVNP